MLFENIHKGGVLIMEKNIHLFLLIIFAYVTPSLVIMEYLLNQGITDELSEDIGIFTGFVITWVVAVLFDKKKINNS